jgi:nicotinic acid mononucleotide adenylyltransferase
MATSIATLEALLAKLLPTGPPTAKFVHQATQTAKSGPRKIGVLSASYNPPTVAHMMLCRSAHAQIGFDEVVFLLTAVNADKKITGATLPQRLQMLERIAQTGESGISAPLSIVACSHPRFVDMAQGLSDLYAQTEAIKPTFYFILGYDTLIRLFDPKYYKDMGQELAPFFGHAHVVAFNRGDNDEQAINEA